MSGAGSTVIAPDCPDGYVVDLKVRPGVWISKGQMVAILKKPKTEKKENPEGEDNSVSPVIRVKAETGGKVVELLKKTGDVIKSGEILMQISSECAHPTLMKNMCAECGADLQRDGLPSDAPSTAQASVSVVHSIPELKVSTDEALVLGKEDESRLIRNRRLVLLVDLDQTLIHTTNENIAPNIKDVYHFQLYGSRSPWYHTRIRPGTAEFLQRISKFYELHICTFGARLYAHTIANFLDQDSKYFSHRILSRDECFDSRSKTANLSSLFPCGDHMVCIIDDREDVWNYAPNLVHVKPYIFFKNTGDINAPPGLPPKFTPDHQPDVDYQRKDKTEEVKKEESPVKEEEDAGVSPARRDGFERRDSIDMPSLDEEDAGLDVNDKKDNVGAGADLDLSDDENSSKSNSSSSSSDSSSSSSGSESNADKKAASSDSKTQATSSDNKKEETTKENDASDEKKVEDGAGSEGDAKPAEVKNSTSESKAAEPVSDGGVKPNSAEPEKSSIAEPDKSSEKGSSKDAEDDLIELEDHDDYLMYLEDILKTIHKAYYELYDQVQAQGNNAKAPDLKNVIPYVKRKVLQGTNLVFSGVIPTHVQLEKSKAYLVARSLGANVTDRIHRDTTHLVAAKLGTAKVNDARKRGHVKLVTPDWLWGCAERWEHVDERLYPLCKAATVTLKPPAHCSSPEIAFAERCPPVPKDMTNSNSGNESPSRMPETLNPFLAFSSEDLKGMDKEVEDILSGDSSSSSSEDDTDVFATSKNVSSESSEDSMTGEFPRGHKRKRESDDDQEPDEEEEGEIRDLGATADRFRHGQLLPADYDIATQSDDEMGDEGEEEGDWSRMAAQLEREFLGDANSNSSFN